MKEVIDKPIEEILIKVKNLVDLQKINKLSLAEGKTTVRFEIKNDNKTLLFELSQKRKVDHKMLNLMRNEENIEIS